VTAAVAALCVFDRVSLAAGENGALCRLEEPRCVSPQPKERKPSRDEHLEGPAFFLVVTAAAALVDDGILLLRSSVLFPPLQQTRCLFHSQRLAQQSHCVLHGRAVGVNPIDDDDDDPAPEPCFCCCCRLSPPPPPLFFLLPLPLATWCL